MRAVVCLLVCFPILQNWDHIPVELLINLRISNFIIEVVKFLSFEWRENETSLCNMHNRENFSKTNKRPSSAWDRVVVEFSTLELNSRNNYRKRTINAGACLKWTRSCHRDESRFCKEKFKCSVLLPSLSLKQFLHFVNDSFRRWRRRRRREPTLLDESSHLIQSEETILIRKFMHPLSRTEHFSDFKRRAGGKSTGVNNVVIFGMRDRRELPIFAYGS